jgi:septum site-determining protein MinD
LAKIISTHSFRGGTGKSNITANLAQLFCARGKRVGIVDTDIQSPGIHVIFSLEQDRITKTLNDYLWGNCQIEDIAYDVTANALETPSEDATGPRLFLIPSSMNTGEIARVLREGYDVGRLNDGFRALITTLKLDYLLIDTHPGVNEETLLSIAVSDLLVLMMRPDKQDLQGTAVTVELARKLEVPNMMMILNKVPADTDRATLVNTVERVFSVPVKGVLPLNAEIASLGSASLFITRFPEHPFSVEIREIAEKIVQALASAQ